MSTATIEQVLGKHIKEIVQLKRQVAASSSDGYYVFFRGIEPHYIPSEWIAGNWFESLEEAKEFAKKCAEENVTLKFRVEEESQNE